MRGIVLFTLLAAAGSLAFATSQARPAGSGRVRDATAEVLASTGAKVSVTPDPQPPPACPADMVEVEGDGCPLVEQICLRPVDPKHVEQDRCAEFAVTGRCLQPTQHRHFCIDRFEWPNRTGVKPVVAVDWDTARDQCTSVGKPLCMDQEWTLACEGPMP
jgi:hypothetical protein